MLTVHQIAWALGVSKGRVYRALSRPFRLPYTTSPSQAKAGGQERYYTIGVLLPRLKKSFELSPEQIKTLFKAGGYNV